MNLFESFEVLVFSFIECFHLQKRLSRANTLFIRWSYGDLVEIYKRHYLLKDTALEIFLSDGQTYLIVFEEQAVSIQLLSVG